MGKLVSYPSTALEDAHEADVSPNGRREVKYPFAFKGLDWEAYHRFRPLYPDSMFNMWSVLLVTFFFVNTLKSYLNTMRYFEVSTKEDAWRLWC